MRAPAGFLAHYRDSMPPSYRAHQTEEQIRDHAHIVWRRQDELAHAEIWGKRVNAVLVCLVTDDRPGVPSLVRATVAAHGGSILAAQTYSRTNERGLREAVHFLWLSPTREDAGAPALGEDDVAKISASLSALLRGETDLGEVIQRASTFPPSRPPATVDVGIAEDAETAGAVLLTVDAYAAPDLLPTIVASLDAHGVEVVHSDVTTSGCYARARLHVIEPDGAPLSATRTREIADAVLSALGP